MRIQLWSYNYDPEPSGIAPLTSVWARAMADRGHDVCVIAAHPHYPKPVWGHRSRPYRESRDGIPVIRLPLWIGRKTGVERIRQELSFTLALSAATPLLPPADVIVAVSPSFPAMLPAMVTSAARRTPLVLWLHDILPDGAAVTGIVSDGPLLRAARTFEMAAYSRASRIVVISDVCETNLLAKGVPAEKVIRIYNPSPAPVGPKRQGSPDGKPHRLLVMGNVGHSQGIERVVRNLERTRVLEETGSEFRIAGHGVAAEGVAAAISTDRVKMLGLLFEQEMHNELTQTTLGFVTQRPGQIEFNLPSKMMNYFAHSVPLIAVVHPEAETAQLVRDSGAGWVVDSQHLDTLAGTVKEALASSAELAARGSAAHAYAAAHFEPQQVAERFEALLQQLTLDARRVAAW